MRFLHISDLHIGKVVNDFSMLEEQKLILDQLVSLAAENKVDALVIAGDIYDRAIPPGEAVSLFDQFLTKLSDQEIQIIMISGNHDSPERISFGEHLLCARGVHIAGVWNRQAKRVLLGDTEFVLLPFFKPVREEETDSNSAVARALERYWQQEQEESLEKQRVLITHFFVTDQGKEPVLSESETTIHVGGLDNVEASLFDGFDYVALGHIHRCQQIGERPVWYSGSTLKYSFGECGQEKCALLVNLEEHRAEVTRLPLHPAKEFRIIRGSLEELLRQGQEDERRSDYLQAVLTDRGELIDPMGTLRSVYPNMMQILRAGEWEQEQRAEQKADRMLARRKDPVALFEAFYEEVTGETLLAEGKKAVTDIIRELEDCL